MQKKQLKRVASGEQESEVGWVGAGAQWALMSTTLSTIRIRGLSGSAVVRESQGCTGRLWLTSATETLGVGVSTVGWAGA